MAKFSKSRLLETAAMGEHWFRSGIVWWKCFQDGSLLMRSGIGGR